MLAVSRDARLLHLEAIVWCNRQLTNGALPTAALRRITDSPDPEAAAAELKEVGLWDPDGSAGWVVDWTDQEDGAEVRKRRDATAERQRKWRRRTELHQRGDHSECMPGRCPALKGVTRDVTRYETRSHPTPPHPLPTRREGGGAGTGVTGTRSADASRFGDHSDQGPPPPHSFEPEPDDEDLADPAEPCTRCGHGYRHLTHFAHDYEDDGTGRCRDCGGREGHAHHLYAEKTGPGGGAV